MQARVDLPDFPVVGMAGQFRQGEFLKAEAARQFIRFLVREGGLPAQDEEDANDYQSDQRRDLTS